MPIITTTKKMRPRDPDDFYPTPYALCLAALRLVEGKLPYFVPYCGYSFFDPGAGNGPWGKAARQLWLDAFITGCDTRDIPCPENYDAWASQTDYRYMELPDIHDIVGGNPPYKHAEAFVRKSLGILKPGGLIVFLLRLAFLEGKGRGRGLWKDYKPKWIYVCSERPSFFPEGHPQHGATDATAYGVFIWQKGVNDDPVIKFLDWNNPAVQPELFVIGAVNES